MKSGLPVGTLSSLLLAFAGTAMASGAEPTVPAEKGTVYFQPLGDQHTIPERYRLEAHSFAYEMTRQRTLPNCGVEIYQVRFPSPITSPCPENNTVYAEYYRPAGK